MKRLLHALLMLMSIASSQAFGTRPASAPASLPSGAVTAIFAGGCFWCVEADFEKLPGVLAAESGYTGGRTVNPTYGQVSAGGTGHAEAVRITYDPSKVSYPAAAALLAQYRPDGQGQAILRCRQPIPHRDFLSE
jgi:peptide-methionine (S)-S-oxide reductase